MPHGLGTRIWRFGEAFADHARKLERHWPVAAVLILLAFILLSM